jgi:hypothetical protein
MAGEQHPGMGEHTIPLPSNDPVLPTGPPIEAFASQAANNMATSIERSAMLSGDIERNFSLILSQVNRLARQYGFSPNSPGAPGAAPGAAGGRTGQAPTSGPNSAPLTGERADQDAQKDVPPDATPDPDAKPKPGPSPRQQYDEGKKAVKDLSMSGVLAKVGTDAVQNAARYASERASTWEQAEDGSYVRRDPQSNAVVETVPVGDPRHERLGREIVRRGKVAGFLAGNLGGEGAVGTLGSVVGKIAGPIGMTVGAINMGGHFLENQNEAAAPYRQFFGQEGTGAFAARERFNEWTEGLRGFGTIGGARARDQYRQASALGLRGDQREQAQDFSGDMFKTFGMDTGESMSIVRQAITSGNASLADFATAIREVSRSAVDAGVASKDAIEEFVKAQDAVSRNVVSGTPSIAIAQNLQGVATSMGKPLSEAVGGASGLATSMLGRQNVMQVAALSGQSPTAALFRMANPATAAAQTRQSVTQTGDQLVTIVATTLGMTREQMRSSVMRASGGTGELSPDQRMALILEWAGGSQDLAGQALLVISQALQTFGMGHLDQAQQVAFFFKAIGGLERGQKRQTGPGTGHRDKGPVGTAGHKVNTSDPWAMGDELKSQYIKYHKGGGDDQESAILSSIGFAKTQSYGGYSGGTVSSQGRPEDSKAFSAYADLVDKTGTGNRAIEALLSGKAATKIEDIAGVAHAGEAKYKVVDAKGKAHEVSLEEAVKDPTFRGQLASGQASIVGPGKNNLTSVSEVTGIASTDTSVPTKKSSAPTKQPPTQQHVVGLAPDARRLLRLLGDGPSDAQRHGQTPSGAVYPSDYPTYGGD